MFNQTLLSVFLAMSILACANEDTTVPDIQCAAGTTLNTAGDTCELNLAEGISVSDTGEIVADAADTEAALAAARAEGRAEGLEEGAASVDITTDNQAAFDEGAASVTPLNCAEGTAVNAAGDACEPTAEYRAAAVEEGRLAGVASVDITSNDADVIAAATADLLSQAEVAAQYLSRAEVAAQYLSRAEVAAQYLSRDEVAANYVTREEAEVARQEGIDSVDITSNDADVIATATANLFTQAQVDAARQEGVDSVTPLNCAEGTAENEAADACEPNLSMDVVIGDVDTIVPTDAYASQVCADGGGTFDAETNACAPPYDCFRGGYCSEAAAFGWFTALDGNVYDGDTYAGSGCQDERLWLAGVEAHCGAGCFSSGEDFCLDNGIQ